MEITYIDDNGDEVSCDLPSKMEVCDKCEGHGTHLNPSIGEHAYTPEEFDEAFPEEEDRAQYFRRGGIYDVKCSVCNGLRVVPVVDNAACRTPEQKRHLKAYRAHMKREAAYRAEERAERRMMGEF